MIQALFFATMAGLAIPAGGALALLLGRTGEPMAPWGHGLVAFAGGALLSAVALVLVPEGIRALPAPLAVALFGLGGLAFAALDAGLVRMQRRQGQLVAMLTDFVPECVALGALFATGRAGGVLLAVLIALQNLPESFNAFGEARSNGTRPWVLMALFTAIALLGPVAAAIGHGMLAERAAILGALMLFSAGGILYLVFQDVAPGAPAQGSVLPPLGAVAGFGLGLAGHMVLHGVDG